MADLESVQRVVPIARGRLDGDLDANGNSITGLSSPFADGDAATKGYVDSKVKIDGKLPMNPLPKYLHFLEFDDTYLADARAWYAEHANDYLGGCSAVRKDGLLGRNYDWNFDDTAEFVVSVSSSSSRHASVGVANIRSDLTEEIVCSGVHSPLYRVLPGRTVDGINDAGVVAEVNVIPRDQTKDPVQSETRNLHAFEVVRHVLDNYDSALVAANYVAANYYIPSGDYSYHWMIADATGTYIVEDGRVVPSSLLDGLQAITNYRVGVADDPYGNGYARRTILGGSGTVAELLEAVKFTNAYASGWPWPDEFAGQRVDPADPDSAKIKHTETDLLKLWAQTYIEDSGLIDPTTRKPAARGNGCWHTVHSSIYDFAAKTLSIAVQEDFTKRYVFAVDKPADVKWDDVKDKPPTFPPSTHTHSMADVYGLILNLDRKRDKTDFDASTPWVVTVPPGSTKTDQSKFVFDFDAGESYGWLVRYDGYPVKQRSSDLEDAAELSWTDPYDGLRYYATRTVDSIAKMSQVQSAVAPKYTKPVAGIPASDLAESVRNSLANADRSVIRLVELEHDEQGFVNLIDGCVCKLVSNDGAKIVYPEKRSDVSRHFTVIIPSGASGIVWPNNSYSYLGDNLPESVTEDTIIKFVESDADSFFATVEPLNVSHDRPKTIIKANLNQATPFDFIYIDGENDPGTTAKVWWDDYNGESVASRTPQQPAVSKEATICLDNVTGPFALYDYLSKAGDNRMVTELETDIGGSFPGYAFAFQRNMKRIVAPNVTQFVNMNITTKGGAILKYSGSGIMNDTALEYADLSGLTTLNRKTCSTCSALKTIRLDSVTSISTGNDQHHFEKCNSIEHVYLSSMTMNQVRGHELFPFDIPEERLDAVRIHCSDGDIDGRGNVIN